MTSSYTLDPVLDFFGPDDHDAVGRFWCDPDFDSPLMIDHSKQEDSSEHDFSEKPLVLLSKDELCLHSSTTTPPLSSEAQLQPYCGENLSLSLVPCIPSATIAHSTITNNPLQHERGVMLRQNFVLQQKQEQEVKNISFRAQTLQHKGTVYSRFVQLLPFLVQRHVITNEHKLFSDLMSFVDVCRTSLLASLPNSHCAAQESARIHSWQDAMSIQATCNYHWQRISITLSACAEIPCVMDVYVDRQSQVITLVDFVHNDVEYSMNDCDKGVATMIRKQMGCSPSTPIQVLTLPLLTKTAGSGKKSKKKKHSSLLFAVCNKKKRKSQEQDLRTSKKSQAIDDEFMLWSLVLNLLVAKTKKSPEQCYVDEFALHPKENETVLFDCVVQSLLYYIAEHDPILNVCSAEAVAASARRKASRNETKSANIQCAFRDTNAISSETKHRFVNNLLKQINSKSKLAVRKQGTTRAGKFKGRQHDKMLCISVNDTLGIQVSFESLFTHDLFTLLVMASHVTCESELSYSDLVLHLPFVFSESADALFGTNFCIVSPYLQTSDPELLFGPVINLLWPMLHTVDQLYNRLKTYKLVLNVQPLPHTNGDAPHVSYAHQFVNALSLCPNDSQRDLKQWYSVYDASGVALGIIQTFGGADILKHAQTAIGKKWGRTIQKNELGIKRNDDSTQRPSHNAIVHVIFDTSMTQTTINTKPKVIWRGSRQCGFAVRRIFKDKCGSIRTFGSLRGYIETEQKGATKIQLHDRKFVLLDAYAVKCDPSLQGDDKSPLLTIDELTKKLNDVDFASELIVVDDLGKSRIFEIGNLPRTTLPKFKSCRKCVSMTNTNDVLDWYVACKLAQTAMYGGQEDALFHNEVHFRTSLEQQPCDFVVEFDNNEKPEARKCSAVDALHREQHTRFRYAFIGARANRQLEYMNDTQLLFQSMVKEAMQRVILLGSFIQLLTPPPSSTQQSFKASLPRDCTCCPSGTEFCLQRVGAILLVLDIYADVQSVATSIPSLVGKTARSKPFQMQIALRCMHDWTQGTDDVFFDMTLDPYVHDNIFFSVTNANHVVIHRFGNDMTPSEQQETRILYLAHHI